MVEGAGCDSDWGCWWGEHVAWHATRPITLAVPRRLVLSPHLYGHGNHNYFSHAAFPANLPDVWGAADPLDTSPRVSCPACVAAALPQGRALRLRSTPHRPLRPWQTITLGT